jgi:hypothetical protein
MLFVDVDFARFVRENEYIERFEQCSMIEYKCDESFSVSLGCERHQKVRNRQYNV